MTETSEIEQRNINLRYALQELVLAVHQVRRHLSADTLAAMPTLDRITLDQALVRAIRVLKLPDEMVAGLEPSADLNLVDELLEFSRFNPETPSIGQDLARRSAVMIDRLRKWVTELQAGMTVNCVYCGHSYGPDPGTPIAMAEILRQHIEKCPEHPLSKALQQIDIYKQAFRTLSEAALKFAD